MARKKYVITLSEIIGNYYVERANVTGQSVSAVMALALTEYLEMKRGVEAFSVMASELQKQELQKLIDDK
jgi:hypothetical protein